MAYIQGTVQPPNQIRTFALHSFNGGLNNRSEILEDNQATNLLNMKFSNDTLMEKRKGFTFYEDYNASAPYTMIKEFRPYTDPDEMMLANNKELYSFHNKIADVTGKVNAENIQGRFYFLDGSTIRVYGRFPQTGGTYVNIVGTPTDVRHIFTVVNPPEGYVPLNTEHVEGKTVYDFTNKKCWYEPCELEMKDPYKGANVLPENPKFIKYHGDRTFLSGSENDNDNVFISDAGNHLYFPVTMPLQLPPNSDAIRGLEVYDNSVVIGRKDDIYVISGKTNNPELGMEMFKLRKLNSHTGIASQQAMTNVHNYLFFLGSDGVAYALSTTNYDEKTLATQIISRQLDIFKAPISIEKSEIADATAVFQGEEWYLSINNTTLVYHYVLRAWTMYDNMNASSFGIVDGELLWGDGLARLSKFSENYMDYGQPYRALWKSKRFDMGDSSITKQFREFQVVAFTFPDVVSDIDVVFEVDYYDVSREIMTENNVSQFGKTRWGDRFINRTINESKPMYVGHRGRLIAIQLSNGYKPNIPVATFDDLVFYPTKAHDTLVYVLDEDTYYKYSVDVRQWLKQDAESFNQSMKVYQVNGEFEFKHKR